ncbi:hypothetical protein DVJ78_11180 [Humibacter sp. BT305]|jgi:hypothetical protein|uniref:DUF7455 domain-containing protein n=1 Tax=Cnuibacter physcomitrellae TaxID=1619308 RepID=A0A1X9LK11_9MICO|nr:hypothetical protein [Cnuibacter physcomitrellae]ARJ05467.1 hypothetical protein B5808_09705 [Cnuibacter physcomitrellae]AXH35892.1 hypothetical protein DVJ78_11180 [Humibacter sp. BT305]MCS5496835.1 hypothetical protein [Cnuibacter physcomitrellae]GGI35753.1 hypothetical protein GCM10010988_05530 [Cnuibacter physcomitrellae]
MNTVATTPDELSTRFELTAADRCDSCGAQAYIRVDMPSGSELLFCAHHGRKYQEKLSQVSTGWHDESSKLLAD